MRKHLLFFLLAALFVPLAVNAQQSLPYSYGFENNNLATDGWTAQITSYSSGINSAAAHTGSYGFRFQYSENPGYLVSPLLTGGTYGIDLSFYYKEYSSSYGDENFQVGYTTDANETDPDNFTYGEIIEASTSWQQHTETLPAGTVRVAIKYLYVDAFYLYLDDFTFEANTPCAKPTNLAATTDGQTATITWDGTAANGFIVTVNGTTTTGQTSPYTFNVALSTTYEVVVVADCGGAGTSNPVSTSFTTPDCLGGHTIEYVLNDSYGDGWNGASITVVEGCDILQTLTVSSGSSNSGTLSLCGDYYEFIWNSGSYDSECSFTFTEGGTTLFTKPSSLTDGQVLYTIGTQSCAVPTDLAAGTPGARQVELSWTENGSATAWQICINDDETNLIDVRENPYTLTGLTPDTDYTVKVRAYCSDADQSCWSDAISFATAILCPKPTGLTAGTPDTRQVELSWTENGSATRWQLCINNDETNIIDVTENPYTLTGLTPDTDYTVKVRANCGGDDGESSWSDPVSFSTAVACPRPTGLTVSNIEPTSATVSWTGEASSYNLRYRELTDSDFATITLTTDDVWGDGSGYQMLLDADATACGIDFQPSGGYAPTSFANFEYLIPVDADPDINTTHIVMDESVTIRIPAGTYDWVIINPSPDYGATYIAASYGTIGGRYNDYTFEGGKSYEFHVYMGSNGNDATDLTITDNGSSGNIPEWRVQENVTNPYTLTLNPETAYRVEVQANCGDEVSVWVGKNFETPSNCIVPTSPTAEDITTHTASLTWIGHQDSYEVQYHSAASKPVIFFDDFDGNETASWTQNNSYIGAFSSSLNNMLWIGYNSTSTEYVITPELSDLEPGSTVEFYQRYYSAENTFMVGFSSTTTDVDAFTWGSPITANQGQLLLYSEVIPDGTKYVAIQATAESSSYAILIDNFGIYGPEVAASDWITRTADATTLEISGLVGDTKYEWQVRGVNSGCNGGYTEWSTLVNFTTEPSCPVPTGLAYSDVTATSVVLSWTSTAALFDIEVNGVATLGVTNPYTLEDLDPETIYTVYVRANCGDEDGYSDWSEPIAFVTECGGAKDLPHAYGFENASELYACWSMSTADGNNNQFGIYSYDGAYEGNSIFVFSSYTNYGTDYDQYLYSPELNAEEAMMVEFYYRTPNGYGSGETFKVGYSTDGIDFTWGDEISTTTTEWTRFAATYPAGTKYVAIHYYANYQYYLYVDGFKFSYFQTTDLAEGWNRFSTYIETEDPIEILDMLKASLGDNAEIIEAAYYSTFYESGEWFGDLDYEGLNNEEMYFILVNNACTVELTGKLANPANHPITIMPDEWNRIAYPYSKEVEVTVALSDFEAEEGDIIESIDGTSYYVGGGEWFGDFDYMIPGQGYMYYSAGTEPKTLVFNTGAKKARSAQPVVGTLMFKRQPVKAVTSVTNQIKSPTAKQEMKTK